MPDYLSPAKFAERLCQRGLPVTGRTVQRWAKDGALAGVVSLPSGRFQIPASALDDIAPVSEPTEATS